MSSIQRQESNAKLSRVVVHNGVAWLAGVAPADCTQDISGQTRQTLARIDEVLALAGTDRQRLLSVQIWMSDMARDVDAMNAEWTAWLGDAGRPARATCQVAFDDPDLLVEIIVTAAV
ncbi:MAG: putative endoribonuclease [Pseudomonas sp.]|jgi:enamine deaminase RidA (YjgF/YER057c/UK114 family)|uniref:RidA family protein n=1 Tax=Pseudomonas sp. TaxID=306 RepID=UPI002610663E|nr:RidA family protein [Pseudomonas sp.]MDB6051215.1 putative endoribonuclease [Pseudomonas sp.]